MVKRQNRLKDKSSNKRLLGRGQENAKLFVLHLSRSVCPDLLDELLEIYCQTKIMLDYFHQGFTLYISSLINIATTRYEG